MAISVITADYNDQQQAQDVMTCLSAYALDPKMGQAVFWQKKL